jgi:hypothetical protein
VYRHSPTYTISDLRNCKQKKKKLKYLKRIEFFLEEMKGNETKVADKHHWTIIQAAE